MKEPGGKGCECTRETIRGKEEWRESEREREGIVKARGILIFV